MVELYSVRVERQDGTTTIRLSGEFDLCAGPDLRAVIADVILGEPPTRLVFDMTNTTFADSTTVNALVLAHHAAVMVGASIEVMASPVVRRVLEVSGVASLFGPNSDLAAAG